MRYSTLLLIAPVIAIAATTTPQTSCAQTAPPDSASAAPRGIVVPPPLALIRPGSYVRVETKAGRQVTGMLHEPIGLSVALKPNGLERPLTIVETPLAEVRSTWTAGSNLRGGAIAGGLIGGFLGYVVSNFSLGGFAAPEPNADGLFAGAAIGALIGAIGGGLVTNWKLVHESR